VSDTPPSQPDEWDGHGVQGVELHAGLVDTWGWLSVACNVLSTISLVLIAVTLIARL